MYLSFQSRGNELEDRVYVGIDDANVEFNLKLKLTGKNVGSHFLLFES